MSKFKKGLVLEVNQNHVIVLTGDGCFMKMYYKGKPPEIGSEIEIRENSFNWKVWSMAGIAALLIVIIIPLLVLQFTVISQEVVAYVTVDINPSIELGLNKEDRVLSVNPLNEDGRKLLEKLDLEKLPVEEALELITEAAIQEKYINGNKENAVIISYSKKEAIKNNETNNDTEEIITTQEVQSIKKLQTDPVLTKQKEEVEKRVEIQKKVMEVVQRNQQKAVVEIIHVSSKVRDQAKQLGLSPGKYSLMLEALDEGVDISPEKVKEKSIVTAIEEAGGDLSQIITQIQQRSTEFELDEKELLPVEKSNTENSKHLGNTLEEGLGNKNSKFYFLTEPSKEDENNHGEKENNISEKGDLEQQKKEMLEITEVNRENFILGNQNESENIQEREQLLDVEEEKIEAASERINESYDNNIDNNSGTENDNKLLGVEDTKKEDKEESEQKDEESLEEGFIEKENEKDKSQIDKSKINAVNSKQEKSEEENMVEEKILETKN